MDDLNKCMKYQKSYYRQSARFPGAVARSAWYPPLGEDNNLFGIEDSTSMNIGSVEYDIMVRSLDENGKNDGTPDTVSIVGNYDPVLDSFEMVDHFGAIVTEGDTLTWDWWRPANTDTIVIDGPDVFYQKKFYFVISAAGHDHPTEWGSGIKNWYYLFFDTQGNFHRFSRAGSWVQGMTLNALADTFRVVFNYPLTDPRGDSVFADLPRYFNKTYDATMKGRDTEIGDRFDQYMFVDGSRQIINSYPVSMLGRWTQEETMQFHFRIVR
jgi:hypothetical protein